MEQTARFEGHERASDLHRRDGQQRRPDARHVASACRVDRLSREELAERALELGDSHAPVASYISGERAFEMFTSGMGRWVRRYGHAPRSDAL